MVRVGSRFNSRTLAEIGPWCLYMLVWLAAAAALAALGVDWWLTLPIFAVAVAVEMAQLATARADRPRPWRVTFHRYAVELALRGRRGLTARSPNGRSFLPRPCARPDCMPADGARSRGRTACCRRQLRYSITSRPPG